MATNNQSSAIEAKRVGKFGLVGIFNTLLDFLIFNLLGHFMHFAPVVANLCSTTVTMIFSFFANKRVVFKRDTGSLAKQALLFYAVTAFGLYVLQTGAIHILTTEWTGPVHLAVSITHTLGLNRIISDTFVTNNSAKAVGTLLSLTWNYITYKKVVFR